MSFQWLLWWLLLSSVDSHAGEQVREDRSVKVVKPGAAPWQWGNGLMGPTQGGQADLMCFPTPDCVQTAGAHFLLGLQGQGVTVHLWHQLGRPVDEIWGVAHKSLEEKGFLPGLCGAGEVVPTPAPSNS